MVRILYPTGEAVILNEQFSDVVIDIEGFLIGFVYTENDTPIRYDFYHRDDFLLKDLKERTDIRSGFFNDDEFVKYISKRGANIPSVGDILSKFKFDFSKILAQPGSSVTIEIVNYGTPYELFYEKVRYNFITEHIEGTNRLKTYSQRVYNGSKFIYYKIDVPVGVIGTIVDPPSSQVNTPGYFYYAKNLGDFINNISDDNFKRNLKKIMIRIIFKVRFIVDEIFPVLLENSGFTMQDVDAIADNPTDEITIDINNALKELMFLLKKSWGYYYIPGSSLPHRSSIPTTFSMMSTFEDFSYHFAALGSFYHNSHKQKYILSTWYADQKFHFILDIFPAVAFSIIPLEIRMELIKYFINRNKILENEEQILAKLIGSIANQDADYFLNFLLEKKNGINTNFERVYNLLDDARTERIPIVNWVLPDEQTNRMTFIYKAYDLWRHSNYSFYDQNDQVKESSFFLDNFDDYYMNTDGSYRSIFLEFGSVTNTINNFSTTNWIDYEVNPVLENEYVYITKFSRLTDVRLNVGKKKEKKESKFKRVGLPNPDAISSGPNSQHLKYHLYQSISIIGHTTDDRIVLPDSIPVPAFLFYYTEDFERIIKIDAQLAVVAQLTFDVVLFFTLNGLSALRHLQYFKHIIKIHRSLIPPGYPGALLPGEIVMTYAASNGITAFITISAGTIYALAQYNELSLPTEEERQRRIHANIIFLIVMLGAGGLQAASRYSAVNYARNIVNSTIGVIGLPAEVRILIQSLTGTELDTLLVFREKLTSLGDDAEIIAIRFDTYLVETQSAFFKDFGNWVDADLIRLNRNVPLNNWETLLLKNTTDRIYIEIIKSELRTNGYLIFFEEPATAPIFKTVPITSKIGLIDNFAESPLFQKFVAKPEKMLEYANADEVGKIMLTKGEYYWLNIDFDLKYVSSIETVNIEASKLYKNDALFISSETKDEAIELLNKSGKFQKGDLIEKPMRIMYQNTISESEEIFLSIDIKFYDANDKAIKTGNYLELDGLRLNKSSNKFDNIISAKFKPGKSYTEKLKGWEKMEIYRQLPEQGTELKNFLMSFNSTPFNQITNPNQVQEIFKVKVVYEPLIGTEKITIPLNEFKSKLRGSTYQSSDLIEINPTTFDTEKRHLLEALYYRIIKD